jgi:hypothetical protein
MLSPRYTFSVNSAAAFDAVTMNGEEAVYDAPCLCSSRICAARAQPCITWK